MARISTATVTALTLHILVFATVIPWGATNQNVVTIWYVALVVGGLHAAAQLTDRAGRYEILRLLSCKFAIALYGYIFLNALFTQCQTPNALAPIKVEFLLNVSAMLIVGTALIAGVRRYPSPRCLMKQIINSLVLALATTVIMQAIARSGLITEGFLMTTSAHVYGLYDANRGMIFLLLCIAALGWLAERRAWKLAALILALFAFQMVLTVSVATQIAVAAAILAFSAHRIFPKIATTATVIAIFTCLVGFTVFFVFLDPETGHNILRGAPTNIMHRLFIWSFAAESLTDQALWFGHGVGCTYYLPYSTVRESYPFGPPDMFHNYISVAVPHSLSLAITTQIGIVGAALMAGFMTTAFLRHASSGARWIDGALLAAIMAWFSFTLFGFGNLFHFIAQMYLWFAVAIFALVRACQENDPAAR